MEESIAFHYNNADDYINMTVRGDDKTLLDLQAVANKFAQFMTAAFGYKVAVVLETEFNDVFSEN